MSLLRHKNRNSQNITIDTENRKLFAHSSKTKISHLSPGLIRFYKQSEDFKKIRSYSLEPENKALKILSQKNVRERIEVERRRKERQKDRCGSAIEYGFPLRVNTKNLKILNTNERGREKLKILKQRGSRQLKKIERVKSIPILNKSRLQFTFQPLKTHS